MLVCAFTGALFVRLRQPVLIANIVVDIAVGLAGLGVVAALLYVLMRWPLPRLAATMARSQELLLVFAVAWGLAPATLDEWAGFSQEDGAFLAGFSLASTPYREAINARLAGLRDFLLLFFFIDLGAKLDFSTNRALLYALHASHFKGQVAGAVRDVRHGQALQAAGVRYILNPFDDAADHAVHRLAGHIHSSGEESS